ncbi:YggS family pyridoxal phosphate-dependent enzyme [Ileibacterium valens]|uniref:Pyridoxal phosphate homeostasis protein n=1 Tax=Ileibacterium valens TaxID=1862668 RepID=A0A1U7NGY7_9FIRM|nr:YggS family pyridoxal phosphate-dependent enzyme [Ileibacterium valens]OLU40670.1 YggS family pyridoxal phosphate enzyme [Erysipelotrichaceae bacterium NYU-BL-E8]OLU40688.1 YggS family pyridoxal phosphate enzyme [Ileibacterium valens]OLU40737.1 YggS family pyridoxal phosphate enzyme [Erysipelotrichaceae bacterium NYU-BL-F16]
MNKELIKELLNLDNVKLVAVSKKHSKEEIDEMARLGVKTFGENRVQEFLEKYDPSYSWHIIGHLQTNKVKYLIGKVDLIESVDSLKLAKEINKQAAKHDVIQNILVELHVSRSDLNKTGLDPKELPELLSQIAEMKNLNLKGLMCIASNTDDRKIIENEFDRMKAWFDTYSRMYPSMDTLSMGMSSDYPVAIEHGSNQIRVGTALFA